MEREKNLFISGDAPGLYCTKLQSRTTHGNAILLSSPIGIAINGTAAALAHAATAMAVTELSYNNCNSDGGYVPTVGRWGSEWPS